MKILIVSTEFPPGPGGIGTHAFQIARGLHLKKHDVRVVSCRDYVSKEEIGKFDTGLGFSVTAFPAGAGKWGRPFVLTDVFGKMKPDLVLATGDGAIYLTAVLKSFFYFPCAAVEHGRVPVSGFERAIKKYACSKMDLMICVSGYTKKQGEEAGFVPAGSPVIHNGADEEFFKQLPENEWKHFRPENPEAKILVTVGNVTERKGQETVIRALPEILKDFPETEYRMIGMPTLKEPFEKLAETLGVSKRVRFLGKVTPRELLCHLNAADIFLMTSKRGAGGDFEGFGIAVVEAALCGKPSVVSGNSGLAEAVIAGKTGITVPESDEKSTAAAVKKLLSEDKLRIEMGRAARDRAVSEQTWKRCVENYEKILSGLLSAK